VIPLSTIEVTEEMKAAAINAMENEFFVLGESVFKFEEEFARYIGTKYAISVSSGTNALHLSLLALGLKEKEKVITSTNSFVASANSILHAGGIPELVDIDDETGNINPKNIRKDVEGMEDVAGIIPVHLFGNPCQIKEIVDYTKEKNLFVIEDAAQAHGAEFYGKKVGSFGNVGCFSFFSTKNMTVCGDGGMITTNDEEVAETLGSLRDCGRKSKYEHISIGFTCRLNTINAAIGRVQLKHLDEFNNERRRLAAVYRSKLPKELLLKETENGKSVYHIFAIKTERRDELAEFLKKEGIQTGVHYSLPIHLQPIYKKLFGYTEGTYPIAERFAKHILSLPMFPSLGEENVKFICEKINSFLNS
jgi:perosamine synthetase